MLTRDPQRALVVVPRRLGDVLLATPVLRSLKQAYPACAIDVLVFAHTEAVLAGNADVANVVTIAERPTVAEHRALARRLLRRYDVALSLVPGDRATLYAWLASRRSIGLVASGRQHAWKKWLLQRWLPFDANDTHTVLMHLQTLAPLRIAPLAEVTATWTAADERAAHNALAPGDEARSPYVVLHPFPKFPYKAWPFETWLALARWLRDRGQRVVVTGGAALDESAACARLADESGALNLAARLSLGATTCVIASARAYVGPDTVTTHLAAALGVPTVALFGPSDPVKWGPWPRAHRALANPWRRVGSQTLGNVALIQGNIACVPCRLEGCDRHVQSRADCLLTLPWRRVAAALDIWLKP